MNETRARELLDRSGGDLLVELHRRGGDADSEEDVTVRWATYYGAVDMFVAVYADVVYEGVLDAVEVLARLPVEPLVHRVEAVLELQYTRPEPGPNCMTDDPPR